MNIAFCMRGGPSVTALQNEIEKRAFRVFLLTLGVTQTVGAIISIASASVMIGYGTPGDQLVPWRVGAGIWAGIPVFVAGICSLISSLRCLAGLTRAVFFYVAYSFELLELITGSLAIMYSMYSYKRCSGTDPDVTCLPDRYGLLTMSLLGTVVNSLMTSMAAISVLLQTIIKSRAVREVHRIQSEEKSRTETA